MDDQRAIGKRRLRVRFSILNLLSFTSIVALTIGWWLDHHQRYVIVPYWRIEQTNGTTVLTGLRPPIEGLKIKVSEGKSTTFGLPATVQFLDRDGVVKTY